MVFSNYINTPEDDEFLRNFPIPDEYNPEWVARIESKLSCQECDYYNDNGVLPCAVNPKKLYRPDECNYYLIKEEKND